jgi:hypothetical protein
MQKTMVIQTKVFYALKRRSDGAWINGSSYEISVSKKPVLLGLVKTARRHRIRCMNPDNLIGLDIHSDFVDIVCISVSTEIGDKFYEKYQEINHEHLKNMAIHGGFVRRNYFRDTILEAIETMITSTCQFESLDDVRYFVRLKKEPSKLLQENYKNIAKYIRDKRNFLIATDNDLTMLKVASENFQPDFIYDFKEQRIILRNTDD